MMMFNDRFKKTVVILFASVLAACQSPSDQSLTELTGVTGLSTTGTGGGGSGTVPLMMNPNSITLTVSGQTTFIALNGTQPYSFSVVAGSGTIQSSTGVYTAPSSAGSATIKVVDSNGNAAYSTVTIYAALAINAASVSMAINKN
jgi:hypothetical protein